MKTIYILKKLGLISVLSLFSFLCISCDGDGSSDGSNANEGEEISNESEEIGNPGESSPPSVANPQPDPSANPESPSADSKEGELIDLIINDSLQQRKQMQINPILSRVARERAEDMASRGYFSHTNPDGKGANILVIDAGYNLPDFYGMLQDDNNIESIAAGFENADETLEQWIGSPGHREHVFGEISFYREQVDFGVGFAADPESPFRFYWVFISARQ